MKNGSDNVFEVFVDTVSAGARYRFSIDGSEETFPDPASRWQPDGPDGASSVCCNAFAWTDSKWQGAGKDRQVLYEMHVGTFTPEGTWSAAAARLEHLRLLGVTTLQLMPIGEFSGRFGWGYDTLQHFAPYHNYGSPDDLRRFIDSAHAIGIGVILDVVYNHVGMGDHFRAFSPQYFTERHGGEWGALLNFDGDGSRAVRDFVIQNAVYWIEEFHFDGLRLDATQAMFDDSPVHIIAEIALAVRSAADNRQVYLIAENQPQDRRLLEQPDQHGYGLDALANDDFHHAAHVAMTGHNDFYYNDYSGTPQEFVASAKFGFLYQGQRSDMRDASYGTNCFDMPASSFVHFLENHDQIANSARGLRLSGLASPARIRAMTALLLLGPQTPCLFQGQEFGSTRPFLYFADYLGQDADAVRNGRIKALSQFPSVSDPAMIASLADPTDPETFSSCQLDWTEADHNTRLIDLHRDLLNLRRSDPAFFNLTGDRRVDGAVLNEGAFMLRYFGKTPFDDRLLLINLGRDHHIRVLAEPLIAPPAGHVWQVTWSSEDPRYGGSGRGPIDLARPWVLPGDTALVFAPMPMSA